MWKLALQLRLQTKQDEEAESPVILLIALDMIIVIHWGLIDKRELYISVMTIKVKWLLVNFIKIIRKAGGVLVILNKEQPAVWVRGQTWALSGKSARCWTEHKWKSSALLTTVNTSFGAQIIMNVHIELKHGCCWIGTKRVRQENIQNIYEEQGVANALLICKRKSTTGNIQHPLLKASSKPPVPRTRC